jgi:hypothetical protein
MLGNNSSPSSQMLNKDAIADYEFFIHDYNTLVEFDSSNNVLDFLTKAISAYHAAGVCHQLKILLDKHHALKLP